MVLSLSDVSSKGFGRSSWETFGDHLKSSRLCYFAVWATFRCVSMVITRHSSAWVTGLSHFPRGKLTIEKLSWEGNGFFFIMRVVMFTHARVVPLTFVGTQEIPAIYLKSSVSRSTSWLETGVAEAKLTFCSEWNSVELFCSSELLWKRVRVLIYADKMSLIVKAVTNANTFYWMINNKICAVNRTEWNSGIYENLFKCGCTVLAEGHCLFLI